MTERELAQTLVLASLPRLPSQQTSQWAAPKHRIRHKDNDTPLASLQFLNDAQCAALDKGYLCNGGRCLEVFDVEESAS